MARAKKIEVETVEAEVKAEEIKEEVDTNTVDTEAQSINEITFKVWDKEYTVPYITTLMEKKDKDCFETELIKKFKLLMQNYYMGIVHATLRPCCGQTYTIQDVKNKLKDMYEIVDTRCSRSSIRFNKETVDTIIDFMETYES